jgi:uncharacterized protein (TIGR00297 family)
MDPKGEFTGTIHMLIFIQILPAWIAGGGGRLGMAAAITVGFAILARLVRGVSVTGAIGGAAVSFVLYVSLGAGAFVALVSVFVLALLTTRLGYAQKEREGTAEKKGGRTAWQVFANLGVAALAAVLYASTRNAVFIVAMASALGEAAADTVSSEFGQARSHKALLITTWEEVPAGTDGGISAAGTIAGVIAAAMVSGICVAVGLVNWRGFWISTVAAIFGMLVDSFLGASLERRNFLKNDAVNFLSTIAAALVAVLFSRIVGKMS